MILSSSILAWSTHVTCLPSTRYFLVFLSSPFSFNFFATSFANSLSAFSSIGVFGVLSTLIGSHLSSIFSVLSHIFSNVPSSIPLE